ncbi:hypothetical protein, partial [Microbulbifer sp. 2205BS26-8]|uniref:hypothetical protein n=1 Tax=Microbulbifer sp. 2205BS26-8 TaxID=3064386 RepID=UPI00273FCA30
PSLSGSFWYNFGGSTGGSGSTVGSIGGTGSSSYYSEWSRQWLQDTKNAKEAAKKGPLDTRVDEISEAIGLSDSEFDVEFASSSEIKKVTKGQAAWGTVNRDGTILIDKSLSTKMNGTRFTQTLAEEMVHVEQIRSGYYKRIDPSYRRY